MPALRPRLILASLSISFSAGFLFAGYELLRSPANTLYKAAYGTKGLPLVMAAVPVAVLLALWIYALLLSWLGPRRTLMVTTLLSGLAIALCGAGIRSGSHPAAFVLYLVREAYIVLIIEQYWSFLNSSLAVDEARKLNGPIMGIASLGSIVGALMVGGLAVRVGSVNLLFLSAVSALVAAALSDAAFIFAGEPKPAANEPAHHGGLGLREFLSSPVLLFILLVVLVTQVVSATLDLRFQGLLQLAIPDADRQTAFSGNYYAALNAAAAFLQFIVTPILLHRASLRSIHLAIPCIHVVTCGLAIVFPTLWPAAIALLLFKAFDYSLFKAAKEILYIPLPFAARYRAKEVIDVFGYRFGKGGIALLIELARRGGMAIAGPLMPIALAASAAWVAVVFPLTRDRSADVAPPAAPPAAALDGDA